MLGVNRVFREIKQPGGVWKNGWYEDFDGDKWYADVLSTDPQSTGNITARQCVLVAGCELGCQNASDCLSKVIGGRNLAAHRIFRD